MARYIDADALGIGKADRSIFNVPEYADGWNSAIDIIAKAPTADVVPRAEVEFLHKTITENAQRALEVTLEEVEKAKAEVAREVLDAFEEILCGEFLTERFWFELGRLRIKYMEGQP